MLLSERDILKMIEKGEISISPFDKDFQLKKNSIDLKISNRYYRYPKEIEPELEILDPKNPYLNLIEKDYISEKGSVIEPKKFFITETIEYIKLSENIAGFIQPKFRLSKLGINLINTGWIESGFEGNIQLCLYNTNDFPVRIFPEMSLVHIFFQRIA